MGMIVEGIPRVCQDELIVTPASLGYVLSVFNENSTLKETMSRMYTHYQFSIKTLLSEAFYGQDHA